MNYLAHIYLSGSSPQIRVGGFIADAVKGGIPEHYPYKLRSGIRLHRLMIIIPTIIRLYGRWSLF